jgi:hypothetical protein
MERLQKPWRLRAGPNGRAFVAAPRSLRLRLALWMRGWRHTHYRWWTKPSKNQAAAECGKTPNAHISGAGTASA